MNFTPTRIALAAALAVVGTGVFSASPAAAAMPSAEQMTSESCQNERAEVGAKAFRKEYGKRPMRKCMRRTRALVAQTLSDASVTCDEELALLGPAAFTEEYTDDTARDPYTMCIEDYVWGELDFVDFD